MLHTRHFGQRLACSLGGQILGLRTNDHRVDGESHLSAEQLTGG
jgi:hypothetical protein